MSQMRPDTLIDAQSIFKKRHVPNILKRKFVPKAASDSPDTVAQTVDVQCIPEAPNPKQTLFYMIAGSVVGLNAEGTQLLIMNEPKKITTTGPHVTQRELRERRKMIKNRVINDDKKIQILEHGLYQWLLNSPHWKSNSMWCNGRFMAKAKSLGEQLRIKDFDYSQEWVDKFKEQHGINEVLDGKLAGAKAYRPSRAPRAPRAKKVVKADPGSGDKLDITDPGSVCKIEDDSDDDLMYVSDDDSVVFGSDDNDDVYDDVDDDVDDDGEVYYTEDQSDSNDGSEGIIDAYDFLSNNDYVRPFSVEKPVAKPVESPVNRALDRPATGDLVSVDFDSSDSDNIDVDIGRIVDDIVNVNSETDTESIVGAGTHTGSTEGMDSDTHIGSSHTGSSHTDGSHTLVKRERVDIKPDPDEEPSQSCDMLMSLPTGNKTTPAKVKTNQMSPRAKQQARRELIQAINSSSQTSDNRLILDDNMAADKLLIMMRDNEVRDDSVRARAFETVPDGLYIRSSMVNDQDDGVFTSAFIPNGVSFGPYEGESWMHVNIHKHMYVWKIYSEGRLVHYLDGMDTTKANWMRFVRSTDDPDKQNIEVFQYEEKIYFRTTTDISPDMEMLMQEDHPLKYSIYSGDSNFGVTSEYNNIECTVCKQELTTATACKTHALFHTGTRPHDCLICGACFETMPELKEHKKTDHPEVSPFVCYNCDEWFLDAFDLVKHSSVHRVSVVCSVCGSHHTTPGGVVQHIKQTHWYKKQHTCATCHQHFTTIARLKKHMALHEKMQFKCIKCNLSFVGFNELMAHRNIHRVYKAQNSLKPFGQIKDEPS